jgi:hypothetical protein
MKLSAGERRKGGDDMWPSCRERGIASFTHEPIYNTDLTNLEKSDVDPAVKGSARPSIWLFAWEIRGGDVIYVGDSATHEMVGRGTVVGEPGHRAYRYNPGDAITEPSKPNIAWRHEVPVQWDTDFTPFIYKDPAPQNSVFPWKPPAVDERNDRWDAFNSGDEAGPEDALLNDLAYQRETPAFKRKFLRLHVSLSNNFRIWLEREFAVKVRQERNRIDLTFGSQGQNHLAELKICYGSDTRHAIREAIGQLFEYNYYPSYEEAHFWWLVLDCEPSKADRNYISALRQRYKIPLTIAWPSGNGFKAFPHAPLEPQKPSPKARAKR